MVEDIETTFIGILLMDPSRVNDSRYLKPECLVDDTNIKLYTWLLNQGRENPYRRNPYDTSLVSNQTGINSNYILKIKNSLF